MKFLLDTCLISELIKKTPHPQVIEWLEACDEDSLFLSVLTIGEIQKGISKLSDNTRKASIEKWLENDLIERFSYRILPITMEISLTWGQISGNAEAKGVLIPTIDCLLAATAIAHNLTLVTRNEKDFKDTPVRILNPWEIK
jgi:predicted nucleic acid-binding protein